MSAVCVRGRAHTDIRYPGSMRANHLHSCRASAASAAGGHQRPALRKQNSCVADGTATRCHSGSIVAPSVRGSGVGGAGRASGGGGGGGGGLRKQLSVDQVLIMGGHRQANANANSTVTKRGSEFDMCVLFFFFTDVHVSNNMID